MKRFMPFFLLCILSFVSCSKKEEKIPDDIIPKVKMVQVMVDIHLAEARSQVNTGYDSADQVKQGYYKFIFSKYKITYSQLMKSWTFYTKHPAIFSEVYDEVLTELSRKQAVNGSSRKDSVSTKLLPAARMKPAGVSRQ